MSLQDFRSHTFDNGGQKRKINIDASDFKRIRPDEQVPSRTPPRPNDEVLRDGGVSPPDSPEEQDINQSEVDELSRINWSVGRRRERNGLLTCLYDRRRSTLAQPNARKKSVRFVSDEKLVKIRFFEENDEEKAQRENVYKTKLLAEAEGVDMKQMEMAKERSVLTQAAESEQSRHKASIDENPWINPPSIAHLAPPLVERGKNSVDKIYMFARQATALSALFLDRENLPDSPDEPSEPPMSSEGKNVALIRHGMNLTCPPVPMTPKGPLPVEPPPPSPVAPAPAPAPAPVAPVPTHNPISFSLKPQVNPALQARPPLGTGASLAVTGAVDLPSFANAPPSFSPPGAQGSLPPGPSFHNPSSLPNGSHRAPVNPGPNYSFSFPPPVGNTPGLPMNASILHAQDPAVPPSHASPQRPALPTSYAAPYQNGPFPPGNMGWAGPDFHANYPPPQPNMTSRIQAKPCLFYGTPSGCRSGSSCRYSHMNPAVNGRR